MEKKPNLNRDKKGKYSYSNFDLICTCGHRLGSHTAEYPHDCCYGEHPENYNQVCKCNGFKLKKLHKKSKAI